MAPTPTVEGTVPFEIPGKSDIPCVTYYKVFGELSSAAPLLVLHGGPGAGHEYLLPLAELWPQYGIPVIFYDQIGCASSTHLPQFAGDKTFWQEPLFIAELNNILKYLELRNGFHLLGHSWGGMLAAAFAASRPAGLKRLVLASALATMKLSEESIEQCRSELPPEILNVLKEYEEKEDYDNPAYQQASMVFNQKYMCRADPLPSEMFPAFKNLAEDQTVYKTMYVISPSSFSLFVFSTYQSLLSSPWAEPFEECMILVGVYSSVDPQIIMKQPIISQLTSHLIPYCAVLSLAWPMCL